jgi:UDP-glucose 4-epimerase
MLTVIDKSRQPVTIANLGTDEYCCVDDSLGWICDYLGVNAQRHYTGGDRGWIGDSPFIFLDTSYVRSLGWKPKLTIKEGVTRTLQYLQQHGLSLKVSPREFTQERFRPTLACLAA